MFLLSCAKPTDPESLTPSSGGYSIVARLVMPGSAQDVEVQDTLAYVAQGEGGLAIVSIADRTRPSLLSVCQEGVRGYSYKLALNDSIAYLAAGGFGINTISVSNPCLPVFVQHFSGQGTSVVDLEIFGTWLVEAKGEDGMRFADLSAGPAGYVYYRGVLEPPGFARGMTITVDSSLLVACGEMGLAIYDLRDIGRVDGYYTEATGYYAWIDLPGYAVDVVTMGNQPIAYLACGTSGVQVVDFSDTSNVRVVGSYATGGYAKEVVYKNGRLYVTTELRGLQILSMENPAAPRLVGTIDTEYALGLAVDERHVYVADQVEGLIVIAIPPY